MSRRGSPVAWSSKGLAVRREDPVVGDDEQRTGRNGAHVSSLLIGVALVVGGLVLIWRDEETPGLGWSLLVIGFAWLATAPGRRDGGRYSWTSDRQRRRPDPRRPRGR